MKLLSLLLIALIFISGFSQPPVMRMKNNGKMSCMMKSSPTKGSGCNKSKQNTGCTFCNFCILCIAFIVPAKPGIQRHFASGLVSYPEMAQSKLTDYNSSPWRPPTT